MKKVFALFLCVALMLVCLPATVSAATFITRVELTLSLPVAEQIPPNNCSIHGNGYTIHSIDWEEIGGRGFLESGEKFKEGYTYEATVWVRASSGYEFSNADKNTPAITGYINGEKVSVTKAYEYNAWAMVCLTYRFNKIPAKGWVKNVDLSVPAPSAGEMPSYTQITGTGYATANVYFGDSTDSKMENGIAWYLATGGSLTPGQDTFGENTTYTFHCLVFPDEGYKIAENATVYVNGKEAEAKLDYDTFLSVKYTFPATEKIPPTHTHTPSDWRITGAYHYTTCTECGDFLDQEDHRWSPTYLYQDKTGHAWVCADCKATGEIFPHIPGPAGTPGAAVVCRDCGYILEPAKDHKHDLSRVPQTPADCINGGNIEYYFCTGCNDCFTDAEGKNKIPETMSVLVGALGHKPADNWSHDEADHWRICSSCKALLDETKMRHSFEAGKCTTCGYEDGASIETLPTEVTQPTTTPATAPEQPAAPKTMGWLTVILIGLVCFGAAITATVIILKKKKKV